jgi:hypothetical protein
MPSTDVRRYHWSRVYGLLATGGCLIALAVAWVVAALADFATWSVLVVAIVGLVVVGCLLFLTAWPPVLLEVSTAGYRVRNVRRPGVAEASWSEVVSVEGGAGADGSVMRIRLSDGRSTLVPLALLGPGASTAEREVHDRLNAAFGYRRLDGS